jgi:hypothetical protein
VSHFSVEVVSGARLAGRITPAVVDVAALRLFVMAAAGWWADQRHETVS